MPGHEVADRTSLALHREVARRLREQPGLVERAFSRLPAMHPYYRDAWDVLLRGPLDDLLALLVEDSERGRDMRQSSPFAGVLDPATRLRVWREARGR